MPQDRELAWYGSKTIKQFDAAIDAIFQTERLFIFKSNIRDTLFEARGKVTAAKYEARNKYISGENMP